MITPLQGDSDQDRVKRARADVEKGRRRLLEELQPLSNAEVAQLQDMAVILRIASRDEAAQISDPAELRRIIKEALHRLDVIPLGLVLRFCLYVNRG